MPLTDDAYMNWNPIWSADGRWLYFASNRGGPMNLWRMPMDSGTGAATGPVQPVSTSTQSVAMIDLDAGGRILLTTTAYQVRVQRTPVDRERGKLSGNPEELIGGSRFFTGPRVSPDGRSIVMSVADPWEDLFLASSDGAEKRRLTDDLARDRGPVWLGGSDEIAFFSDRSGRHEIWKVGRDGSGLEQLTSTSTSGLNVSTPSVSPDGRWALLHSSEQLSLVDLDQPWPITVIEDLSNVLGGRPNGAPLWYPDGKSALVPADDDTYRLSIEARTSEKVAEDTTPVDWLVPEKTFLGYVSGTQAVVDVATGESRQIGEESDELNASSISADGYLYATRTTQTGDIWLMAPADAPE